MASRITRLLWPNASYSFNHSISNDMLTISGSSRTYEEYTIDRGTPASIIANNTSVALKIRAPNRTDIILFPGETHDYGEYLSSHILLTIYPCVLMNLLTVET